MTFLNQFVSTLPFPGHFIALAEITGWAGTNKIIRAIATTTRNWDDVINMIIITIEKYITPIASSILLFVLSLYILIGMGAIRIAFTCTVARLDCATLVWISHPPLSPQLFNVFPVISVSFSIVVGVVFQPALILFSFLIGVFYSPLATKFSIVFGILSISISEVFKFSVTIFSIVIASILATMFTVVGKPTSMTIQLTFVICIVILATTIFTGGSQTTFTRLMFMKVFSRGRKFLSTLGADLCRGYTGTSHGDISTMARVPAVSSSAGFSFMPNYTID